MDEQLIRSRITALYPDAIVDVDGRDCSFEVYVISELLGSKNTLQRQQSILELFGKELRSGRLHALSIKARTPQEQAATVGLIQIQL